ncbi:25S rRNA (adenine2142-N1)-methyltransferase [Rhizina undulata]
MAPSKKPKRPRSILLSRKRVTGICEISSTLPPTAPSLSSKAGRTLIRKHHTLQKRLSQARARNETEAVKSIQADIDASGGLEKYQLASVCGQSSQRGGDSSKILMDWIHEIWPQTSNSDRIEGPRSLRLLEVGALSPDNACSKSSMFNVTRIDLNSRHPSIETQDFMERAPPTNDEEKFDIISLSLVLNYVPLPDMRGEMLRRTTKFLREKPIDPKVPLTKLFPSLFFVLPAPCVTNSRYLDEDRLTDIMESLGYKLVRRKLSAKLVYQLWRYHKVDSTRSRMLKFKKEEVNPGKTRNNFAVVLE